MRNIVFLVICAFCFICNGAAAQTRIRLEQLDARVTDRVAYDVPVIELANGSRTSFTLDGTAIPLDGEVQARVNGALTAAIYNSSNRTITFNTAPSNGAAVTVSYSYNTGRMTSHVIRGGFNNRVRTSNTKLLWIGDSITSNLVSDRITQRAVLLWPVPCTGAVTSMVSSGGNWPVIVQGQPCGTPILNATNISALNTDNSFNDANVSGRFTSGNGFAVGEFVQVSGFTAGGAVNNGTWQITSVPNANKIIVTGVTIANASAGPSVTMATCSTGFNEATFGNVRPGEPYPPNSSIGINTSRVTSFSMFGDVTNFGSPYQFGVNTTATYEANWDTGFNAQFTIIAHTQPDSPAQWNIQCWDRTNTNVEFFTANLRQSSANRFFKTPGHARGTGVFNTIARFSSWNETENNTDRDSVSLLNFGVELTNKPNGIFWAYIGDGGWKARNHMSGVTTEQVSDAPNYNGYYTDATLDTYIDAFDLNTYIIWIGQNIGSDEWNGTTIGNYKSNVLNIIARYKASAARVGVSNPRFVLVSTYETSADNTRFILMADALREIALADTSVEFVDLRMLSRMRAGAYASIQASRMPDTIHPNQTYSDELANWMWEVLNYRPTFRVADADEQRQIDIAHGVLVDETVKHASEPRRGDRRHLRSVERDASAGTASMRR